MEETSRVFVAWESACVLERVIGCSQSGADALKRNGGALRRGRSCWCCTEDGLRRTCRAEVGRNSQEANTLCLLNARLRV